MAFAALRSMVESLRELLDHQFVNRIESLIKPAAEVVNRWIWRLLELSLPILCCLELFETIKYGCVYEGESLDG